MSFLPESISNECTMTVGVATHNYLAITFFLPKSFFVWDMAQQVLKPFLKLVLEKKKLEITEVDASRSYIKNFLVKFLKVIEKNNIFQFLIFAWARQYIFVVCKGNRNKIWQTNLKQVR